MNNTNKVNTLKFKYLQMWSQDHMHKRKENEIQQTWHQKLKCVGNSSYTTHMKLDSYLHPMTSEQLFQQLIFMVL